MIEADGGLPGAVRIAKVAATEVARIDSCIKLGDLAKKTLGQLPFAVYTASAERGTLVAALVQDRVVGYVLYRLSRRRVTLVHLCVATDVRKNGIARALVEYISETHRDRPGVMAKCRQSYGIDQVWLKLGFNQQTEVPGRNRQGLPLVVWWRDHGHPTLMSRQEEPALRACFDMTVLEAIQDPEDRDHIEAAALAGDDLYQQLQLIVTVALRVELTGVQSATRRRQYTDRLDSMVTTRHDLVGSTQTKEELRAMLTAARGVSELPWKDQSLVAGLADCISAGVTVFVTFESADTFFSQVMTHFGVRVMRPLAAIVHLEELARSQDYRPIALSGSDYHKTHVGADNLDDLSGFVDPMTSESAQDLKNAIAGLRAPLYALTGPDDVAMLLYATEVRGPALCVPLIRVRDSAEALTLARQILFALREQCRRAERSLIRILDPLPSPLIKDAATAEGFILADDGHMAAVVIDLCAPMADVEARAVEVLRTLVRDDMPSLRSGMPATAAAEFERAWWPARLLDADIPTYAVSIEARWAAQLFGVPQILTGRPAELALSREHVYYRSLPQIIDAPARVLWYVKKHKGPGKPLFPPGIIGCSLVEESYVADVDELMDSYRHLGVWDRSQVTHVADEGRAQVIRFTDTEIFPNQVTLSRLEALAKQYGQKTVPQAPIKIAPPLFAQILTEGQGLRS
ncbi:GNAT family N-acetyltransferase [Catellatospora sichuanensis]|uniref:GNAT family N-acetyltransferase n=1 Tax=Catellatospora sichuanensis TaxID=1969805 RepID=UPI001642B775|nr:GNAT family N-acetyltransferase [Catellatospora sichuanensis]